MVDLMVDFMVEVKVKEVYVEVKERLVVKE